MPLFGQKHRAGEFSDSGRSILNVVMVASSIPLAWYPQHGEQFLFVMASDFVTQMGVTYFRKSMAHLYPRSRPHDDGNDSMPSGHAISVSARTSLAMLNMPKLAMAGMVE